MKSHKLLNALVLAGAVSAFGAGCIVHARASATAEAAPVTFEERPTLVAVGSGVWVVRQSAHATYYVSDAYWVYRDGVWYRSSSYSGGWVTVEASVVPIVIVRLDHSSYVHYAGSATAETRPAPGEYVAVNDPPPKKHPHGGPPGHEDLPASATSAKTPASSPAPSARG